MTIEQTIQNMLNKPYAVKGDQNRKFVCWSFCKDAYDLFGLPLKAVNLQSEFKRITVPTLRCIVMFQTNMVWHAGVVWPDGLHFIHACPRDIFDSNPQEYFIRQDRLTGWPYKLFIEGYYVP